MVTVLLVDDQAMIRMGLIGILAGAPDLPRRFHAGLLPWRNVVRLPLRTCPAQAVEAADRALRRHSSALLAVTAASNVTGELWPVAELAAVAHRHGARIAADAAQLAPHAWTSSASTTSPSPATSCTPRSAPACWPAAPTGSTPPPRTCPAAAPPPRSTPRATHTGRPARPGTRPAPPTCSAPSPSPPTGHPHPGRRLNIPTPDPAHHCAQCCNT
jgi:hypothetical protein